MTTYQLHTPYKSSPELSILWKNSYIDYSTLKAIIKECEEIRDNIKLIDSNYKINLPIIEYPIVPTGNESVSGFIFHRSKSKPDNVWVDDIHNWLLVQNRSLLEYNWPTMPPEDYDIMPQKPIFLRTNQIPLLEKQLINLNQYFFDYFLYHIQTRVNAQYQFVIGVIHALETFAKDASNSSSNDNDANNTKNTPNHHNNELNRVFHDVHILHDQLRTYVTNNYSIIQKVLRYHDKYLHTYSVKNFTNLLHHSVDAFKNIDRTQPFIAHSSKEFSLRLAAQNGDVQAVWLELTTGSDLIDSADYNKETPLTLAALHGHNNCVKLLLDYNADINSVNTTRTCALTHAILQGHEDVALTLINYQPPPGRPNINLDISDAGGQKTPLMYAAQKGMVNLTAALLKAGAEVECRGRINETALLLACEQGKTECVKLLLRHGASILHQNGLKQNSIAAAATGNHAKCLEVLLRWQQKHGGEGGNDANSNNANEPLQFNNEISSPATTNTEDNIDASSNATKIDGTSNHSVIPHNKNDTPANKSANMEAFNAFLQQIHNNVDLTLPTSALPIVSASARGHTAALDLLLNVFSKWSPMTPPEQKPLSKKKLKRLQRRQERAMERQRRKMERLHQRLDGITLGEYNDDDILNSHTNNYLYGDLIDNVHVNAINQHELKKITPAKIELIDTGDDDEKTNPESTSNVISPLSSNIISTSTSESDFELKNVSTFIPQATSSSESITPIPSQNRSSSQDTTPMLYSPHVTNTLMKKTSRANLFDLVDATTTETDSSSEEDDDEDSDEDDEDSDNNQNYLHFNTDANLQSTSFNSLEAQLLDPNQQNNDNTVNGPNNIPASLSHSQSIINPPSNPLQTPDTPMKRTRISIPNEHSDAADFRTSFADLADNNDSNNSNTNTPLDSLTLQQFTPHQQQLPQTQLQILQSSTAQKPKKTTTTTTHDDDDVGMLSPLVSTMTILASSSRKDTNQQLNKSTPFMKKSSTEQTSVPSTQQQHSTQNISQPSLTTLPSIAPLQNQASNTNNNTSGSNIGNITNDNTSSLLNQNVPKDDIEPVLFDPTIQQQQPSNDNTTQPTGFMSPAQQHSSSSSHLPTPFLPSSLIDLPLPTGMTTEIQAHISSHSHHHLHHDSTISATPGIKSVVREELPLRTILSPDHSDVGSHTSVNIDDHRNVVINPPNTTSVTNQIPLFTTVPACASTNTSGKHDIILPHADPVVKVTQLSASPSQHQSNNTNFDVNQQQQQQQGTNNKDSPGEAEKTVEATHQIGDRTFSTPPLVLDVWEEKRVAALQLKFYERQQLLLQQQVQEQQLQLQSSQHSTGTTGSNSNEHIVTNNEDATSNNVVAQSSKVQKMAKFKKPKKVTFNPSTIPWIDLRDKYGCSALLRAAEYRNLDAMKLLLKNGANPDTSRLGGRLCITDYLDNDDSTKTIIGRRYTYKGDLSTPLMLCANHNDVEGVRLLLQYKATVDIQRLDGATALLCAADRGLNQIVELLLNAKADANLSTGHGYTPLTRCAVATYNRPVYKNCMELLLQHGADFNRKTSNGSTGLILAATRGVIECVQTFLSQPGIDLDSQDNARCTALIRAAMWGHVDVLTLLLERGADMNKTDVNGNSALHVAASGGYYRSVKVLLHSGADYTLVNKDGITAREIATHQNHVTLSALFKQYEKESQLKKEKQQLQQTVLSTTKSSKKSTDDDTIAPSLTTSLSNSSIPAAATPLSQIPRARTNSNKTTQYHSLPNSTGNTPSPLSGLTTLSTVNESRLPTPLLNLNNTPSQSTASPLAGDVVFGAATTAGATQLKLEVLFVDKKVINDTTEEPTAPTSASNAVIGQIDSITGTPRGQKPSTNDSKSPELSTTTSVQQQPQQEEEEQPEKFLLYPFEDCAQLRKVTTTGDLDRLRQILVTHRTRLHGYGFGSFIHTGPEEALRPWVDLPDQFGNTALILAAAHGRAKCLEALLQDTFNTCNVNAKNSFGRNALMSAARKGYSHCVKSILKDKRLDITALDELGHNVIHLVVKKGHTRVLLDLVMWMFRQELYNAPQQQNRDTGKDGNHNRDVFKTHSSFTNSKPAPLSPIPSIGSGGEVSTLGEEDEETTYSPDSNGYFNYSGDDCRSINLFYAWTLQKFEPPSTPVIPLPQQQLQQSGPIPYHRHKSNPKIGGKNINVTPQLSPLSGQGMDEPFTFHADEPNKNDNAIEKNNDKNLSDAVITLEEPTSYNPPNNSSPNNSTHNAPQTTSTQPFQAPLFRSIILGPKFYQLINQFNIHNETPLFLAASNGHLEAVELLLRHRALPDLVYNNRFDYDDLLLEDNVNHNSQLSTEHNNSNEFYDSPLVSACLHGHTEIVRLLLSYGADPHFIGTTLTPLNAACLSGHEEIIQVLLAHNVNIEARDRFGSTALIRAVRHAHLGCVVELLKNHADVNAIAENGSTALLTCALEHHPNSFYIGKALLLAGAEVNFRGEGGSTALLHAADKGFSDLVKLLLQYGANPHIPNTLGHTPLFRTVFWNRSAWANHECMTMLLNAGSDPNWHAEHSNTALHIAAYRGITDAIIILINHGADPNVSNNEGMTPLMRAAAWGFVAPLQALLHAGAETHVVDNSGRTALWQAAAAHRLEAIRLLLDWKSPWGTRAYDNTTPLDIARKIGAEQVVSLLEAVSAQGDKTANGPINYARDTFAALDGFQLTPLQREFFTHPVDKSIMYQQYEKQHSRMIADNTISLLPLSVQDHLKRVCLPPHNTDGTTTTTMGPSASGLYSNDPSNHGSHNHHQSQFGTTQHIPSHYSPFHDHTIHLPHNAPQLQASETNLNRMSYQRTANNPNSIHNTYNTYVGKSSASKTETSTEPLNSLFDQLTTENQLGHSQVSTLNLNSQPLNQYTNTQFPIIQNGTATATAGESAKKDKKEKKREKKRLRDLSSQQTHTVALSSSSSIATDTFLQNKKHTEQQQQQPHQPPQQTQQRQPPQPQSAQKPSHFQNLYHPKPHISTPQQNISPNPQNTQPSSLYLNPHYPTTLSLHHQNNPKLYHTVGLDSSSDDDDSIISGYSFTDAQSSRRSVVIPPSNIHATPHNVQSPQPIHSLTQHVPQQRYNQPQPSSHTIPAPKPINNSAKTIAEVLSQCGLDTYLAVFVENGVTTPDDLKYLRDGDYDVLIPTLLPRRKLQRWIEQNL